MRVTEWCVRSLVAVVIATSCAGAASAQTQPTGSAQSSPVRRLTLDEAIRLALEHNLGLEIERFNPQLQDIEVIRTRGLWMPTLTSTFLGNSTQTPSTSIFAGGEQKVTDTRYLTEIGVQQLLPTGGSYSFGWNSSRSTSSNIFTNFDPLLNANLRFEISQPLLRNQAVDQVRQTLAVNQKFRHASDVQLRAAIVLTTRNVKNAYWGLIAFRNNLTAARQSLELSRRLLGDNERRVQVGTMAPIDIVEAQAEVATNEEAVILAEAAIQDAEDRLRSIIFTLDSPGIWTETLEPADTTPLEPQSTDVELAVRTALSRRTDLELARNNLAISDLDIRYFRNQILPDLRAQASYGSTAAGGSLLAPLTSIPIGGEIVRPVQAERSYGAVVGDVLSSTYPAWSIGMTISYPLGTSAEEADLARSKLLRRQRETELKSLELQVALEVRTIAREVQTNQKRLDTTRVTRELTERRVEAAEKKLAAGVETTFFVAQAQRDLAEARTNEVRAQAEYTRSVLDLEAVQEVPLIAVRAGIIR
jgi:outer membrane protein TolC